MQYSIDGCRFDCAQKIILDECGCLMAFDKTHYSGNYSFEPVCTAKKVKECATKVIEIRNRSEIHSCTSKCYPPCNAWEYSTAVSSAKFPSAALLKRYENENLNTTGNIKSPLRLWSQNLLSFFR